MTAQSSEDLQNEHPTLRLGKWSVYAVIRGEPAKDNHGWGNRELPIYDAVPIARETMQTSNWKGYTEVYRLTAEGTLVLVRFDFDLDFGSGARRPSQLVNETLGGSFYLVVKSDFEGPRMYIPFREGAIVLGKTLWLHEAYVGNSPIATKLARGPHPDFPRAARLWYELDWPPDTRS